MGLYFKNETRLNLRYFQNIGKWSLLFLMVYLMSCQEKEEKSPLFIQKNALETGIDFTNTITENDTHNILNFTNLYTGSGVGIGDFNNDGLPDVFLGGNMESSRLYLNKGNLKFEDITKSAKVSTNRWVTGVTVVDINTDGWDDIYLSVSGNANAAQRKNLLFINNQDNTFSEQAERYQLADTSQCTHANFFDYDKDGDLDVVVIVNPTNYNLYNVNTIRSKKVNGEAESTDKLYRNNGDFTFSDVSTEAGILIEGYSLGLNISDLNGDGWADIYITNDFLTNDILYVNNHDGTFTNKADEMLRHTSFASMGVDIADINNDGFPEIYVLDMLPEDNYRQKMIMGNDNYDRFQYMLKMGYQPQYSRNTLQWNNGDGTFSEIGQLANVHKTDWSWSALLADYDNDGLKDLYVTNGFRRDLGDLDYINYTNTNPFGDPATRKQDQLKRILEQPGAKLPNYIFKNENGLTFSKKSKAWGIDQPSYSHGAAFADLDDDGDLDLVVNNVSMPAFIYENQANTLLNHNFLTVKFETPQTAIGTKVWVFYEDEMQFSEYTPYRGYQSSVEKNLHFGLGKVSKIDSVKVEWNDGSFSLYTDVGINESLTINKTKTLKKHLQKSKAKLFEDVDAINYVHTEDNQIDFKTQFLLPHQHSKSGPCMAKGDINGDGLEDFYIGGAAGFSGMFFIQNDSDDSGKTFTEKPLNEDISKEDTDCLFFDADNDGDLDLYVVSGGVVYPNKTEQYEDRLYINENGVFSKKENALPKVISSGSCVIAEDFDKDGDIDLFVGGRVVPTEYPRTPKSYLLENNDGIFKDITPSTLANIGMVTAAIWTDFDQDNDQDLMLAGEFMPITIFKNEKGNITNKLELPHSKGWWNTLAQGDFDNDGDLDYLGGNLGLNTNYRASAQQPVSLYANDFDENGKLDPVLCQYIDGIEYPVVSRDKLIGQIPPIKVRFDNYKKYAKASFSMLFKRPEKKGMQILKANNFQSSYIENIGNGVFKIHALPIEMQIAPLNDFWIEDINEDGNLDALVIGNTYATEVGIGRYDAFTGGLMIGDGKGGFDIKRGTTVGFVADKDAKSLLKIKLSSGESIFLIGNNEERLQIFKMSK